MCIRDRHNIEPKENEHFINLECLIRQQSSHKANYIKYAQNELGIKENRWIHYYYRKQINLNKLEELKNIGIDILKESHDFWGKNYIRNSLNISTIIEGRIESKLQSEKEYNVYEVSINQIIHNDYLWKGANKVYVKASIPGLSLSLIHI